MSITTSLPKGRSLLAALSTTPLLVLSGVIFVVAVLLPGAPWPGASLGTDPGVFLYFGSEILSGSIPYRDMWDHKPPAIFYINALGLSVSDHSRWGVWALEVVSLCVAAFLSFVLIRRSMGTVPALFGTGIWLASLPLLLDGGNYTEEFALPFQFTALYLFQRDESNVRQGHGYGWRGYAIGAATAVAFLLKQNLIGVGLSIVLVCLWVGIVARDWRGLYRKLASIFLGGAAVLVMVAIYFAIHNALFDLWEMVFLYNFLYVSVGTLETRLATFMKAIEYFGPSSILLFSLAGWLIGASRLLPGNRSALSRQVPLLAVSVVNLPVELLLSLLSDRPLAHYYIAWLPGLALLSAFLVYYLSSGIRRFVSRHKPVGWHIALTGLWPLILLAAIVFQVAVRIVPGAHKVISAPAWNDPVIEYIQINTTRNDSVLIWGAAARYNFLANRRSPTKYVYQWPLYRSGYVTERQIERFLHDLEVNKPRLIIDTSPSFPVVPSIDPLRRQEWKRPEYQGYVLHPAMSRVLAFISSHYEYGGAIEHTQWPVYVYAGP